MKNSAFILLESNPVNSISLDVLQPLLKAQGLLVQSSLSTTDVPANTRLLFIEAGEENAWEKLQQKVSDLTVECDIILFNIGQNPELANRALLSGIRGVFYANDNTDVLMKGIRLLLENHLWYKRDIMCSALNRLLHFNKETLAKFTDAPSEPVSLTKREKAIISLMSTGSKNKEIADKLDISPHTVKTHLYSAFRKTKCRNRIELLSWAQHNIPNELR
ncbi:helix-turn-helix transcriptional regulator [Pseudoalteromonas denitrificans]|uniref:Regulatory protein, luxR family n=1 Tax=Pseudoalteromonas denitrificans DSM 6059 TaxID=1123010 RepID=A0A1I1PXS8_9GAMM|nr:response regulator transcription factor [Pseudoalteromonas denitrificans]SFD14575.1 regulatory protein, luxR family [Pseudoalteromonas denitrificans DSM 6059]